MTQITQCEVEEMIRHQKKVMKAFQDSINYTIRKAMRNMYPNTPLPKLHEWGLVVKTTLTRDGIEEDDGGIRVEW